MCEGGAGRRAAEDGDAGGGVGGHVEQTGVKFIYVVKKRTWDKNVRYRKLAIEMM